MPVLFIGDSKEIRDTLAGQLRDSTGTDLRVCTFDQAAEISQIVESGVRLIVAGVESARQAEIVDRVFAEPSVANRIPVVVFARTPSGAQVLNWMRLGSAAVELWPCQSSRIGFLLDYLTVGCRIERQPTARPAAKGRGTTAEGEPIVLASAAMQQLVDQIGRVAPLDANVLLSGETGVGKTRLARLLHDRSARHHANFTAVNCGALPENLLESELFGHRRGAFTGADADRKGRFEDVGEGTLFLDEVDSIPITSQCKLLRAIENRVFEPLGSNNSLHFRGRIVAASNSSLERLIETGEFRADLFYRLGVVDLHIPPLRERREDIRPIAEATLMEYAVRNRLPVRSISQPVIQLLEAYAWPGNVRQLRNVIESSASLCRSNQIEVSDLSGRWLADARTTSESAVVSKSIGVPGNSESTLASSAAKHDRSLAESRANLEEQRIRAVLIDVGNNRTKAAIQLGISRTMLYKKLTKYRLSGV